MKVFVIAGEKSGDHLGAGLIRALRARDQTATIAGIGGPAMEGEGLLSLFPMADIAVMGFVPVIARLPLILRRIRQSVTAVAAFKPDVLVIIDSPDFTHRVARRLRKLMPSLHIVDYVSPSVWAWRPGRAKAMRAYIDHVLALLPFEPDAHQRLGGPPCTYVGHPLVEHLDALTPSQDEQVARHRDPPLVLVLPGSRRSEIDRLLWVFGEALARIEAEHGPIDLVLPSVPHLRQLIGERTKSWPNRPKIIATDGEKYAAFRSARGALAASGTVTLELALAGVPQCVGYKVAWAEGFLKYLIKVPSIVLPNLILGRNAVPEFLQEACTPQALAAGLIVLLQEGVEREAQIDACKELRALMRAGEGNPSERAADIVLRIGGNMHFEHAVGISPAL